ncbi:Na+/H+ antiporter [Spirosoma radiotolerans]|uniref:Sodium:hydrogen antiporter n=1 Tax=Spirosoma radiotolerans TaxID=1379870 RepID=A0A0E3ZSA7_9BACT|nr:Na+/H+ antiporter [Spirosoma radiotolerans]AKD54264.1 sodium:hydrogen antiporter [Spirosoma radiotolerans]
MHPIEIVTSLLGVTTLLAVIARRLRISYPILLVITGLVIGWVPGLPPVILSPDAVFLVFLPPLLYYAAWQIDNVELKLYSRSVSFLAVGLVLFTSTVVALVAYTFIPGFSLAQGYLLGAIIAPPDAIAASSVMKGLNVPKRITTVLEGESLINDASSLIIYRYGLIAILTSQFVLWKAGLQFIGIALASVLLGLLIGWVAIFVHKAISRDTVTNTAITLLIPYGSYLIAEELHISGVLVVVTVGLYVSARSVDVFTYQSRLQTNSVWETVVFLLNGLVFILIGLQLPTIVSELNGYTLTQALNYALLISAVAIICRIIWVFPGAYLPRWFSKRIRQREVKPSWQQVSVVSWAGMRGVVSLAGALALPLTLPNGQPFPGRDLILFITFGVIFCTLVLQGLTLPVLIDELNVRAVVDEKLEERKLRRKMAQQVITHLEANHSAGSVHDDVLNYVKNAYELRINELNGMLRANNASNRPAELYQEAIRLQLELLSVERAVLSEQRKDSLLDDDTLRKLEQELDLEAARLSLVQPVI